ncbi:unnamed protein product [Ambrosiozyma monospora]|uniref:Unnamed protein product n=1 Tax=Ambrosiozyma monospora TaxID=43982 RepID=A0ACB5T8G1_AMBMO|nr:unnamed protein product [Ambrosiozyma monospora]
MRETITARDPCWSYLPRQIQKIEISSGSVDQTLSFGISLGNIYKSIEIYTWVNSITSSHFAINVKRNLVDKIEKIAKSRNKSAQFVHISCSPKTQINILNPWYEVIFPESSRANILTYTLSHVGSFPSDFDTWHKCHHWSNSLDADPVVDEFEWGLKGSGLNARCSY